MMTFLTGAALASAPGAAGVALLDASKAAYNAVNCQATMADGVLSVTVGEIDALIDFSLSGEGRSSARKGPAEIRFRMRIEAATQLDQPLIYWVAEGETQWKQFARAPSRPDGEWHDYRLLAPSAGRIAALRFSFGRTPHAVQLSDVSLAPVSLQLPESFERAESAQIEVERDGVTASFDALTKRYTIVDANTERTWRSEPLDSVVTVVGVERQSPSEFRVRLFDHFTQRVLTARTEVLAEPGVRFELQAEDYDAPLSAARFFPPRFSTDLTNGHVTFCDRSCGVLLEQSDNAYASWPMRVYGNTNCLDMPWVGLFDDARGDGAMLLVETPADAEVALAPDEQGRHWPEVRWLDSLDSHRYPRVASLRFTAHGRHVELARRYREHLKSEGRFKTLAEKAGEKPAVERLKGAPALWGGRYPTKFIRQMRHLGVTRGVVSNCRDAGIIRWLNELGYLTGRYDSYTDFVEGPRAFQSDSVAEAAIVSRPGGAPRHGWKKRSGEQMYWRSSALWASAAASYTPDDLAKRPYNSRFIDVAAAADLIEDYHAEHTFDRRQDLANRRALFDRMNSFGLVLGTEHGNDWVVDQVEYFEGSMSGPFWWSSWPAGYLDRPKREQLTPKYLKYGMGFANRVPLWELVFHDCANSTWYWGDTAGLLYEAAPELADRKDLFNILYGTMPLFWMNGTGYKHPSETHRMLRSFHDTCPLHEVVGFEQLISHEFLTDDRAVQRTRFANQTEVVVNFADEPRSISTDAAPVTLAARGYHVVGPGFQQSRLETPTGPETVIVKDGYLTVASDGSRFVRGVRAAGRLTAFRVDDERWNLFVDPGVDCEVNLYELTGWSSEDAPRLCYMDDLGEIHSAIKGSESQGVVRFRTTDSSWRFVVVRRPQTKQENQDAG